MLWEILKYYVILNRRMYIMGAKNTVKKLITCLVVQAFPPLPLVVYNIKYHQCAPWPGLVHCLLSGSSLSIYLSIYLSLIDLGLHKVLEVPEVVGLGLCQALHQQLGDLSLEVVSLKLFSIQMTHPPPKSTCIPNRKKVKSYIT